MGVVIAPPVALTPRLPVRLMEPDALMPLGDVKAMLPEVESRLIFAAEIVLRVPSVRLFEAVMFTWPVPGVVADVAAPNVIPPLPAFKLTVFTAVIEASAF